MPRCVHCAKPILKGEEICPSCGGEQPVTWMVTLAYALVFLFVQGAFYRLIWPNATSLYAYGLYFTVTTLAAAVISYAWKRLRRDRAIPPDNRQETDSD